MVLAGEVLVELLQGLFAVAALFFDQGQPQSQHGRIGFGFVRPAKHRLRLVPALGSHESFAEQGIGDLGTAQQTGTIFVGQPGVSPLFQSIACDGQRGCRFLVLAHQQRQTTDFKLRERVRWSVAVGRDLAVEAQRTVELILFRQHHGHALEQFRRHGLLFGGQDGIACRLRVVIERVCQRKDVFHDGHQLVVEPPSPLHAPQRLPKQRQPLVAVQLTPTLQQRAALGVEGHGLRMVPLRLAQGGVLGQDLRRIFGKLQPRRTRGNWRAAGPTRSHFQRDRPSGGIVPRIAGACITLLRWTGAAD